MVRAYIGVSNGLCEHLRACEQSVYFCEHEQCSIFSCERRALSVELTNSEQRAFRKFSPAEISVSNVVLRQDLIKVQPFPVAYR